MQDINYDKVLKGNVTIVTFKGKEYEIEEPPLERILAFERETEKLRGIKNLTKAAGQIKRIIRTIYTTVPETVLDDYPPKALYKILVDTGALVRESMLPEFTKSTEVPEAEESKKVKKKPIPTN